MEYLFVGHWKLLLWSLVHDLSPIWAWRAVKLKRIIHLFVYFFFKKSFMKGKMKLFYFGILFVLYRAKRYGHCKKHWRLTLWKKTFRDLLVLLLTRRFVIINLHSYLLDLLFLDIYLLRARSTVKLLSVRVLFPLWNNRASMELTVISQVHHKATKPQTCFLCSCNVRPQCS